MKVLTAKDYVFAYTPLSEPAQCAAWINYARSKLFEMIQMETAYNFQFFTPENGVQIWVYKNPNKILIKTGVTLLYIDYQDWSSGGGTDPSGANVYLTSLLYKDTITPKTKNNFPCGGQLGYGVSGGSWLNLKKDICVSWSTPDIYFNGHYVQILNGTSSRYNSIDAVAILTAAQIRALFLNTGVSPYTADVYVVVYGNTSVSPATTFEVAVFALTFTSTTSMTAVLISRNAAPVVFTPSFSRDGLYLGGYDPFTNHVIGFSITYSNVTSVGALTTILLGASTVWSDLSVLVDATTNISIVDAGFSNSSFFYVYDKSVTTTADGGVTYTITNTYIAGKFVISTLADNQTFFTLQTNVVPPSTDITFARFSLHGADYDNLCFIFSVYAGNLHAMAYAPSGMSSSSYWFATITWDVYSLKGSSKRKVWSANIANPSYSLSASSGDLFTPPIPFYPYYPGFSPAAPNDYLYLGSYSGSQSPLYCASNGTIMITAWKTVNESVAAGTTILPGVGTGTPNLVNIYVLGTDVTTGSTLFLKSFNTTMGYWLTIFPYIGLTMA